MPEKKKQGGAMPEMKNATRLKNPAKVIKRLLSYLRGYTVRFIIVLVCIVISAGASAFSAMFIQLLIDNYMAIFKIDEANKKVYVVTVQYQGRDL